MKLRHKILREIDRIWQQVLAIFGFFFEPLLQMWHDQRRHLRLKVLEGECPVRDRMAILLVFQPKGISASTLLTCQHLRDCGYSVLLVSNAQLNDLDRARIGPLCWRLVERPNYGYDFGGYRDGIWILQQFGVVPEKLLILNDSIWFPVVRSDQLIARMEALSVDLAGAVTSPMRGSRGRNPLESNEFIESYIYLIGGALFSSEAFSSFWRSYRVSSVKYNAVHRGERTFSRQMQRAGYSVDAVITREKLKSVFENLDNERLLEALGLIAYKSSDLQREGAGICHSFSQSADWRTAALLHLGDVLRAGYHAALFYLVFRYLNVSIIKKANGKAFRFSFQNFQAKVRAEFLRAVEEQKILDADPVVVQEVKKRCQFDNHQDPLP